MTTELVPEGLWNLIEPLLPLLILLEARFRNEGTVHEAPQGTIEARNVFGG